MSKITFSKENLEFAVKDAECFSDVLSRLGLVTQGGSSRITIRKYCSLWGIDISHILSMREYMLKHSYITSVKKSPIALLLVENSTASRTNLKRRLYKEGFKNPVCEFCGQTEVWMGKKISLILDHINGVNNDNRLENLRILCPNCNATLDTHCSKNIRLFSMCECGKKILPKSVRCHTCTSQANENIVWPTTESLSRMVWEKPTSDICRELGVSDSAIAKRCKRLGIQKPSRGYWQKQRGIAQMARADASKA